MTPHTYVFVLSPPFSGSTPLYRLLGTSPRASTLFGHDNWAGEGQFLPEVAPLMRPNPTGDPRRGGFWDPSVVLPWAEIKPRWDARWDLDRPVLVEKSPPTICRARQVAEYFSAFGPVYFVALIRSPYAVKQSAERWVEQAEHQRRNVLELPNLLWLTYEQLCDDVAGAAERLSAFVPGLGPLDPEMRSMAGVVGGERGEGLSNKNEYTLSVVRHRNEVLERHADLMAFFGYSILRDGCRPEIECVVEVPADRASVVRAWTEPEWLGRWWHRATRDGDQLALAVDPELELHVRVHPADDGAVRWTCAWSRLDPVVDDTVLEVELHPTPTGTRVVARELRVPRSNFAGSTEFWTDRLTALRRAFE